MIVRQWGGHPPYLFALTFLLIVCFEGALRKWFLPAVSDIIFFARVPLLLLAALWGLRAGYLSRQDAVAYLCLVFAAGLLGVTQLMVGGFPYNHLLIVVYGLLNYLMLLPFALMLSRALRRRDLMGLGNWLVAVLVCNAVIVVLQYSSDPGAYINSGGVEGGRQFRGLDAAFGKLRPTGLFTSDLGNAVFTTFALGVILGLMFSEQRSRLRLIYMVAVIAALITVMFSLSRLLVVNIVLLGFAVILAGILAPERRARLRIAGAGIVAALTIALWPVLSVDSFSVFMERIQLASDTESQLFDRGFWGRLATPFSMYLEYFDSPILGYLIGLGGNAAQVLSWVQLPAVATDWTGYGGWAEDGWSRHVVELGPVLGVLVIVLRVALVVYLFKRSLAAAVRGSAFPLMLFGFAGPVLLIGQITGHGTVGAFAWLSAGLLVAGLRRNV